MNYHKAEDYFKEAIQMTKDLLGEWNPHVFNRYRNFQLEKLLLEINSLSTR